MSLQAPASGAQHAAPLTTSAAPHVGSNLGHPLSARGNQPTSADSKMLQGGRRQEKSQVHAPTGLQSPSVEATVADPASQPLYQLGGLPSARLPESTSPNTCPSACSPTAPLASTWPSLATIQSACLADVWSATASCSEPFPPTAPLRPFAAAQMGSACPSCPFRKRDSSARQASLLVRDPLRKMAWGSRGARVAPTWQAMPYSKALYMGHRTHARRHLSRAAAIVSPWSEPGCARVAASSPAFARTQQHVAGRRTPIMAQMKTPTRTLIGWMPTQDWADEPLELHRKSLELNRRSHLPKVLEAAYNWFQFTYASTGP
ncbi:hypothetical protein WJX84_007546 [Apatococcus fuscideae]|uniref:Uncharacterized protein n=1 Tax=Apatococcus fuscideae TaxID=2026836 RepID=A0AAW1TER0_9CHLO